MGSTKKETRNGGLTRPAILAGMGLSALTLAGVFTLRPEWARTESPRPFVAPTSNGLAASARRRRVGQPGDD